MSTSIARAPVRRRTTARVPNMHNGTPSRPATNAVRADVHTESTSVPSNKLRHAASETASPTWTDRHNRATSGAMTKAMVVIEIASAIPRNRCCKAGSSGAVARTCAMSPRARSRIAPITTPMQASCRSASTVAPETSPMPKARRAMSLSRVLRPGPPSTRMTAYDVKQ